MDRRLWARWMFGALSALLSFGAGLVPKLFAIPWIIGLLFPNGGRSATYALLGFYSLESLLALLCLGAYFSLGGTSAWRIWVGRMASISLLPWIPWFAPLGAFGLWALSGPQDAATPAPAHDATGSSGSATSRFFGVLRFVLGAALLIAWSWVDRHASRWGLPPSGLGAWVFAIWAAGEMVQIAIHESGHMLMAWAVGFRIREINIGPVTRSVDDHGRVSYRFAWDRLMGSGGYVGAIPSEDENARMNTILVLAAGPLVHFMAALTLALAALSVWGTSWEPAWGVFAALALMFLIDLIPNLLPLGRTDGAFLYHLILWTPEGQDLYKQLSSGVLSEQATASGGQGNFEDDIRLREAAITQILQTRKPNPTLLCVRYMELGSAQIRMGRWTDAEQNLRTALDHYERSGTKDPGLAATCWSGLHSVYDSGYRFEEAEHAYDKAIAAFTNLLLRAQSRAAATEIRIAMAQLHVKRQRWPLAQAEIGQALEACPEGSPYDGERAFLLARRAECEYRLGFPDRAAQDIDTATALVRRMRGTSGAGDERVVSAYSELAEALKHGGRTLDSAALLDEAAAILEAGGFHHWAFSFRFRRTRRLRDAGRHTEAEAALPPESTISGEQKHLFYSARGWSRLDQGRTAAGILDLEEAVRSAANTGTSEAIRMSHLVDLAEGYQVAGRDEEALDRAQTALAFFNRQPCEERADLLLTLSLLALKRGDPEAPGLWQQAQEATRNSIYSSPAERVHWFDRAAMRWDRVAFDVPAQEARRIALEIRQSIGLAPVREAGLALTM